MGWIYRTLVRPILFLQDAETVHNRTLASLAWVARQELVCEAIGALLRPPRLPVEVFGLHFPNPVGLAAGLDKNALALPAWEALGFGFTELGGVTWHAQPGNPQPRVFRAVAEEALINRMGFNNQGAFAMAERLERWRALGRWPRHPVGINLGKSRVTPLAQAAEDYARSFRALWPHADFFVVNVSSPNTPHLRQLQDKAALDDILAALQEVNLGMRRADNGVGAASEASERQEAQARSQAGQPPPRQAERSLAKPILVKVAPDLDFSALDDILELAGPRQVAGIVATNTTLARPESGDPALRRLYAEPGGLSGRPLRARSTEIIRHLFRQTRGRLPIIGVGGIFSAEDAWEKITAGAALVQLYTGLVYEGPAAVKAIVTGLVERLAAHGLGDARQAVGIAP